MESVTETALFFQNCTKDLSESAANRTDSVTIDPTINFIFNGIGILLLAVFGISANLLSVIVLTHPKLKSSLGTLLLGLTISDIFVISTSLFIFSVKPVFATLSISTVYATYIRPYLLPWLLPVALTAQMSSLYFTVIITLERYIAVCLPLHARSICTRSSAQKISLIVVLVSVLYNIPRWFEYETVRKSSCDGTEVTYAEAETEFRRGENYVLYYINWGYLVIIYLVPFTILLYFNIAIYRKTKLHRTRRNSLSPTLVNRLSEDIQLAGMLFGIVITFIACNLLALVINVMESFGVGEIGNLIPINNFLIVCSSSTNFVFYCVFGTEFRRRLKKTLGITPEDDDDSRRKSSTFSCVVSGSLETVLTSMSRGASSRSSTFPGDTNNNGDGNGNNHANSHPSQGYGQSRY